ncbi:hypothetical protein ABZ352_19090 [Streptomyces griseofuscus]|uniref:hypothetical protein n=1 Tax=Streptomyces griseofuscus TaxID=146922 RepID=UPI0033F3DD21
MTTVARRSIPYVTSRTGEEADSALFLCSGRGGDGLLRLAYRDEGRDDRDIKDVLWARVSQNIGSDRLPEGDAEWKLVHPARQRETMLFLRCQVCVRPAKGVTTAQLPDRPGVLFLETAGPGLGRPIRTAQPPVCVEHAHEAARRCKHLVRNGHVALLATRFRLYGVLGTPYTWTPTGVRALPGSDDPVPYGDPRLRWFLASQLVRELREYEVVNLADLVPAA